MIIRPHSDVASQSSSPTVASALLNTLAGDDSDGSPTLKGWSSIIGIITAIIGNVLISFALNIQRYAHIRLSREENGRGKRTRPGRTGRSDYGMMGRDPRVENDPDGEPTSDGSMRRDRRRYDSSSSDAQENEPLLRASTSMEYDDRSSHRADSANPEKATGNAQSKTYLRSPYWWAGITLMTIGEAGNFLAYGFAPASIVSPLGVVALVSNCVIAPIMLKERFRKRDFGGVVVAIAGAVTVVLSAKTSEKKLGPHAILDAISRWEFELYVGLTITLILAGMWASGKYGHRSILIDLGLVGLFGGYTALATKGVASLLSYTLWRALTFPITYALLFILISTALLQIRYVNRALQRFDSTQVIPTQFVLFTISVIIGSAILYRDFEHADATRIVKFLSGCLLTFLGVYLITSGRSTGKDDGPGEDEDGDVEDHEFSHDSQSQDDDESLREGRGSRRATISTVDDAWQDTLTCGSRHNTSRTLATSLLQKPERLGTGISQASYRTAPSRAPSGLKPAYSSASYPSAGPPRLQKAISSPVPQLEADGTPEAPPGITPSSSRPSTLSRRSMARILPGPYLTPLSSSLAAVVADSLRREVDPSPSRRRMAHSLEAVAGQRDSADAAEAGLHERRGSDATASERSQATSNAQGGDGRRRV